ncbi:hypothetical protein K3495_g16241 [Podosphaera aphanis]|nr:hypothetical protein K3495_g16241 [Podosphaera aphanis]
MVFETLCKVKSRSVKLSRLKRNRPERSIFIQQEIYVTKLLEKLEKTRLNPNGLPIPAGTVMKSEDTDHDFTADEVSNDGSLGTN